MSTNQILDKVATLKAQDEQTKKETKKRKGVWAEVETFVDKSSGIGVVITERVRGRPSYSFQLIHFDDHGGNKFIPIPCDGASRPLKEVVYLLIEKAEAFIEEKRSENAKHRSSKGKQHRRFKTEKKSPPTRGLSDLARRDAEKQGKGDEYVGKTARKKKDKGKK